MATHISKPGASAGGALAYLAIGLALAAPDTTAPAPAEGIRPMPERFLFTSLGWITSRAGDDYYPTEISDALVGDWEAYAPYLKETGFTAIGPWGFLCNTFPWPLGVDVSVAGGGAPRVSSAKVKQARRIVEACRANGITFYYGLCLYFAYWQDYVAAAPGAAPHAPSALCPLYAGDPARGIPGSLDLMKQAIDFVMATVPVDGFALESFHHGRCLCPRCVERFPDTPRGTAQFHLYANLPVFEHIRAKHPGVRILFCPEGPLEVIQRTENLDALRETLQRVDAFVWCGAAQPPDVMRELARAAPQTALMFRQEPWQSVPPPASDRDGWFFPNLLHPLGGTIHQRAREFAWAGVAGCGLGKDNPCDDVNLRFLARMQMEPSREPEAVLLDILREIYRPKDEAALRVLLSLFEDSEKAFRRHWQTWFMHIDFMPKAFKFDVMQTVEIVGAYQVALARLRAIRDTLENREEAERLERSIVKWIAYIRDRLDKEYGYAMP